MKEESDPNNDKSRRKHKKNSARKLPSRGKKALILLIREALIAEAITKLIDAAIAEGNAISTPEGSQGRLRNIDRRDDIMDVVSDQPIADIPHPTRLRRGGTNSLRLRANQRMKIRTAVRREMEHARQLRRKTTSTERRLYAIIRRLLSRYQRNQVYHILRRLYTEKNGRPQIQWMEKILR